MRTQRAPTPTWLQKTVATNLRSLRQFRLENVPRPEHRSRYTEAALAADLGIDPRTYRALEAGDSTISLDRLLQLARYLEVSPVDLVVPPLHQQHVLIQAFQRGGKPEEVEAVPLDVFLRWWRGHGPLSSQNRRRWLQGRGWRRNDVGFADARFTDPQARVEARDPKSHTVVGHKLEGEPVELPERRQASHFLEQYWAACAAGDDDAIDRAFDGILEALDTGRRRAQGDDDPEAPMWNGRRVTMVGQDDAEPPSGSS